MSHPNSERTVRLRHYTTAAAIAGAVFALVTLGAISNIPNAAAEARGVAVETTRDINDVPTTPVEYQHAGQQRTEMVPWTNAAAGETVTFPITGTGEPASGSWAEVVILLLLAVALSGCVTAVFLLMTDDDYRWRRSKAREHDRFAALEALPR